MSRQTICLDNAAHSSSLSLSPRLYFSCKAALHTGTAQLGLPPNYHGAEHSHNTTIYYAGILYVQVDQQDVNPSGWPILLHPSACSRLAFVGSSDQAPLLATAGDTVSVMVETQDRLQQRICQVSCI